MYIISIKNRIAIKYFVITFLKYFMELNRSGVIWVFDDPAHHYQTRANWNN